MFHFFISDNTIPTSAVTGEYQPLLVFLSYVIATLAAYTAIAVLRQVDTQNPTILRRGRWLGATVMGAGVWSMHFTGMLAFKMNMVHTYNVGLTALSMVAAIVFSYAVFYNITLEKLTTRRIFLNAPIMGIGVALMHYVGMEAMQMEGEIKYRPDIFALSILIGVIASGAAMWIMNFVSRAKNYQELFHIVAAMAMGLAVCGMHYTGMEAAVFLPFADCRFDPNQDTTVLAAIVLAVATIIIGVAFLSISSLWLKRKHRKIRPIVQAGFVASILFMGVLAGGYFVYSHAKKALLESVQQNLVAIAKDASSYTDGDAHQQITSPDQKYSPLYTALQSPYRKFLSNHKDLAYIYTVIEKDKKYYFIIDTRTFSSKEDDTAKVMEEYKEISPLMVDAIQKQVSRVQDVPYSDKWGTFLSAYEPIYNSKKEFLGIVGVDIRMEAYNKKLASIREALLLLGVMDLLISAIVGILIYNFAVQRRAIETQLVEERHFVQTIMDAIPDPIFVKDHEHVWKAGNKSFWEMMGGPAENFLGKKDRDVFPPEQVDVFWEKDDEVIKTGKVNINEEPVSDSKGNVIISLTTKSPLMMPGSKQGLVGIIHDITESKKAEALLKATDSFKQTILDSSKYAIISADLNGTIQTFNNAAVTMLGYSSEEMIGKLNPGVFHDQEEVTKYAQKLSAELGRHIEPGFEVFTTIAMLDTVIETEWTYVRKDGSTLPVSLALSALYKDKDKDKDNIIGYVGIATDITERKRYENEIRRFQRIISHLGEGVFIVDLDGLTTFANDAAERMLGYRLEEMLHTSQHALIHHHYADGTLYPKEQCNIYQAFKDGKVHETDKEVFWRKDGSSLSVEYTASPTYDEAKNITGASVVFRDISERKQHEEELRKHRDNLQGLVEEQTKDIVAQKDRAEKAAQAKSEFLSNMSHELRTPMHAILNYANMGLKRLGKEEPEKLEKYLSNIQVAGNRLLGLLNNLLDLAKMDSGKMKFSLVETDFKEVIEHTQMELDSLLKEKNLKVKLDIVSADTKAVLDKNRMIQIAVNIFSNAIKYSPENGTILVTFSEACLSDGSDALCCSIANDGDTIPDNELEAIFDKFVQSSKTKTGAGGTGLGLAISREIIEAHGGKIWAENGKITGVVFSFLLPKKHTTTLEQG